MGSVQVVTSTNWKTFAKGCKAAGDGSLMRDVRKNIRTAGKGVAEAVKVAAPNYMPDQYAAELVPTLKISTSATASGVSIRGRAKTMRGKARELRKLEAGRTRHPLWGNRRHWAFQTVRPGFWSEPLSGRRDELKNEIRKAMDRVADRIAR